MTPRVAVAVLAAAVLACGVPVLFRPGYSPDEEFTLFAVRGIAAHGLPLLPSGLLYDRGLLYSYVCWLATSLTGLELPVFRALSLAAAAGAIVLGYDLVRRLATPAAGAWAALLVATSVPFWATATTGRFYPLFLLTYLAVLTMIGRGEGRPRRWLPALCALAGLARLSHELAFTLMAVPALGAALAWIERHRSSPPSGGIGGGEGAQGAVAERPPSGSGRVPGDWLVIGVAIAMGLVAAQALLTSLHFLDPGSGTTMIRRFFVWQVVNLLERPQGAPLGIVLACLIVTCLLRPSWGRRAGLVALGAGGLIVALAVTAAGGSGASLLPQIPSIVGDGFHYPLDMFWHLASVYPVMLWTGLALLLLRLAGTGGAWPARERAVHLAWVGWVLWFGVIDSGITLNYLLLPTVCLLAAIAIDLSAIRGQVVNMTSRWGQVVNVTAWPAVALLVAASQWWGPGSIPQRLAIARPTIAIAGIESIRNGLQPTDRVACTDELACLLLVGRADAWLALDDYVRERFLVQRGSDLVGVYAGAPAFARPAELFGGGNGHDSSVIVVDVFKDYAVGSSSGWLPRALAADHLAAETLLSTPQARVVRVLPTRTR